MQQASEAGIETIYHFYARPRGVLPKIGMAGVIERGLSGVFGYCHVHHVKWLGGGRGMTQDG